MISQQLLPSYYFYFVNQKLILGILQTVRREFGDEVEKLNVKALSETTARFLQST